MRRSRVVRPVLLAVAPPLATFAIQTVFWPTLHPFAWFLFYPTVFISSWYGGFWSGVGATVISTVLVWWRFLPPEGSFEIEHPKYLISTTAYVTMGLVFARFHEHLRRLQHASRVFEALVDNSSDFIGIADAQGKPVYVNPAGRRMVGIEPSFPVEKTTIPEYYPPGQRAFASDVILKSMIDHGRWEGETYFRDWKTERAIPVSDTHFTVNDPATGDVLGMGTITRDISARKRTEDEQRFLAEVAMVLASTIDYEQTLESVARLAVRDLADCCVVDLVEGDEVRRVVIVHKDPAKLALTKTLQRMPLDRQKAHLVSSVLATAQPLLLARVTPEYLSTLAQSEEHAAVMRELAPKSLMVVPLAAHGQLLGALVFLRTTTPASYDQEDLRVAMEVATRAALAMHNAELYAKAQRATQARDEMLGVVAHDLRNPLNALMLHAQLLKRGIEPEQSAAAIRKAALRMNRLIEDLLDVTRIDAHRFAVTPAKLSLAPVVEEVLATEGALASEAKIELTTAIPAALPEVLADRHRLSQLLENLVGNSMKFTPAGGRITVGADKQNGSVRCFVRDTGMGISAEALPHVFDRFWQATKTERKGVGLGLAIARGIVEAHGGRIWVESTVGKGTTFYFTIPAV